MKNFKKILVLMVLVLSSITWFASCSCSTNPQNPDNSGGGNSGGSSGGSSATYTISCSIDGTVGGTITSSTGSNSHRAGDSPEYLVTPYDGFAVMKIKVNNALFFTHEVSGLSTEPVVIPFSNISKNYEVVVTFYQITYTVETNISNSGYSSNLGGVIECSDSDGIYFHGDSTTYTIIPNEGFCVYEVKVDGEKFFEFNDDREEAVSADGIEVNINNILGNHTISVAFYELMEPEISEMVDGFYYKEGNTFLNPVVENVATAEILGEAEIFANGGAENIKLTPNKGFNLYKIAINGGTSFDAEEDYEDPSGKFVYFADGNIIQFAEFDESTEIEVFAVPDAVRIIIYKVEEDGTTNSTLVESTYYVGDTFNINSTLIESYDLYYSTSENAYQETSTWISASIDEGGIVLAGKMILKNEMLIGGQNAKVIRLCAKFKQNS